MDDGSGDPAPPAVYTNSDLIVERPERSPRTRPRELPGQPAAEWPTSAPREGPRVDPTQRSAKSAQS